MRAGGTIDADWPLERAFKTGDAATGGKPLMELYDQLRASPVTPDLPALGKQLGIERTADTVKFHDHPPLAAIRNGILPA